MKKFNSKIKYIFFKIISRFFSRFLIGKPISPGIIYKRTECTPEKAIFLLDDSSYIHLGDQLFWGPIIIALHQANYPIEVLLPGDMNKFWECNGIKKSHPKTLENPNAIYLTYSPMTFSRRLRGKNIIAVDLTNPHISNRISVYLCNEICRLLNVKNFSVPELKLPQDINKQLEKQITSIGNEVWLMNDLLVSGVFRLTANKRKRIWIKANEIAQTGGKIIYIKGENEVTLSYLMPNIISLDLRGKTTPDDIMGILQLPNVKGTISFDNFLMHSSLLCGKKAYVMFRGRFSYQQKVHCYKKVNIAFDNVNSENIIYL